MSNNNLNQYGLYPAAYCRETGLPMYDVSTYGPVADVLLSKTRCKRLHMPVQAGEEPVAFYRLRNGYTGLYPRPAGRSV